MADVAVNTIIVSKGKNCEGVVCLMGMDCQDIRAFRVYHDSREAFLLGMCCMDAKGLDRSLALRSLY
jgi:hypothetical protein